MTLPLKSLRNSEASKIVGSKTVPTPCSRKRSPKASSVPLILRTMPSTDTKSDPSGCSRTCAGITVLQILKTKASSATRETWKGYFRPSKVISTSVAQEP
eukprot:Skav201063  [mRNA]  locus=scaffold2848:162382:165229:+ [translate_table: standard]